VYLPRWLGRALRRAHGDGVGVGGIVTAWTMDERGRVREFIQVPNTATDWACYALAAWYLSAQSPAGAANGGAGPQYVAPARYIAVGTGVGQPNVADIAMFPGEIPGVRQAFSYTTLVNATTAQVTSAWTPTSPTGTVTDFGLLDAPVGSASVGSGGVSAGATVLPLAAGAPAVAWNSDAPGQYQSVYIDDPTQPEAVSIGAYAAAGAAQWTLQAPLAYAHAAGTPIIVFGGNLFAHAQGSITIDAGSQLSVQWSLPFEPATP
jgi:hypothetical protein